MKKPHKIWQHAKSVETDYAIKLRKAAEHVASIIHGFDPQKDASEIEETLARYAETLDPWARAVASRMLEEVSSRDRRRWRTVAKQMGRALHAELDLAPTGQLMHQLMRDQVNLIKSIPLEAAERVHEIAIGSLYSGERQSKLVDEILKTGEVTRNRANMIAYTETARASSMLTAARAVYSGSTHFIWHTQRDAKVRPSHRKLDGKIFKWDDPPLCDPPDHHALPGAIWNCRCYSEPIWAS